MDDREVPKIWIIIPAYNEAKALEKLLVRLKQKYNCPILVIDDGSTDDTYNVALWYADLVLHNEKNLGKGGSLKRAKGYLLANKDVDYVLTMDADNQHDPEDVQIFIREAQKGEAFVIGNRMDNPEGMPRIRIWANKIMSRLISWLAKQKIKDTQCGFRLIRRDVLEEIGIQNIETNNFEIESEVLVKAAYRGFSIKSIPIKSIYFKQRMSKINPVLDTLRFIRFLFGLRDERIRFCHPAKKNG